MSLKKTLILFQKILKFVAPPIKLKVSEWADTNRKLSSETSAEPGKWKTDRAPYQKKIMDTLNDTDIEKIVVVSSSQVGKSEIINNIIGYYIDIDPCPMLLIQPTVDTAQDYSKRRLAPMIRDTEVLATKVSDTKSRDLNNTILMKVFSGGFLAIGGANSPAGLASRPIRVLLADEIDRYPVSAGSEGDPLVLAEKRTTTFWNKKKIFVSTPTNKNASRIEVEYESGTREKWCLECPECGDFQFVNLYGIKFQHSKDEKGNYKVWDVTFQCPACLEQFDEYTWKAQLGTWISDNPEAKKVRSFHLNAFVSPWVSWVDIVKEWLEVKKDPARHKVFKNTVLGETWEDKGEIENEDFLIERCENYKDEVPARVLILTASVDVQDDRLEYEIVGWGKGEETWGIEKGIIMGVPDKAKTWSMLLDKLNYEFTHELGFKLKVACTCVDSGGHFTKDVYKFCKENEHKRVFAIKGMGGEGISIVHKIYRSKLENATVFILGVDSGKTTIIGRLKIKQSGEGYCHFPNNENRGYDRQYFKGLISERLVKQIVKGKVRLNWEKISKSNSKRNEPLDLRVYAFAALKILNPNFQTLEQKFQNPEEYIEKSNQKTAIKRRGVVKKGIEF